MEIGVIWFDGGQPTTRGTGVNPGVVALIGA
jgi:hypothetical protein